MKKNRRFEEIRRSTPGEIDIYLTRSFDIVDRIHEILQVKNLGQKDLAVLLDKKESEISKWMTGSHNFTLKTLSRIEEALGTPLIKVIDREKILENQQVFIEVKKKYAQIPQGNDILIGDLRGFVIKSKYQKPTLHLS